MNNRLMFIGLIIGIVLLSIIIVSIPMGKNSASLLGVASPVYSIDFTKKYDLPTVGGSLLYQESALTTAITLEKDTPVSLPSFLLLNTKNAKGIILTGNTSKNSGIQLSLVTDRNVEIGRVDVPSPGTFTQILPLSSDALLLLEKSPSVHVTLKSSTNQLLELTKIEVGILQ